MNLSLEQQISFDLFKNGKNVFMTGPGGCGKSKLIKIMYGYALELHKNIQVCALTGCAALLLNCKAKTIHSWAGIGLGNMSKENLYRKICKTPFFMDAWRKIEILIVDEVSMLSLKIFDILNYLGKKTRKSDLPFGGIQLIFSGDFHQLPPIGDDTESKQFCFESEEWETVFPLCQQIPFEKIFRQTDEIFTNILHEIRNCKMSKKTIEYLKTFVKSPSENALIEPTKLYPTKKNVEQINIMKLSMINEPLKTYEIEYYFNLPMDKEQQIERLKYSDIQIDNELDMLSNNGLFEKQCNIKIGSQVMCVVNYLKEKEGFEICNGSQGIVKSYCDITGYPIVEFYNGLIKVMSRFVWQSEKIPGIGIGQVPLILSWALTIHKCQGSTLDTAEIDIGSGIFACGQTYVALSRVKSLEGLYLTSFDSSKVRIHKKVKEYYKKITEYYHQNKPDINIPLVIAEQIPIAELYDENNENNEEEIRHIDCSFLEYQYVDGNFH
jgi:ATP-dependent DNA helicase PIF1